MPSERLQRLIDLLLDEAGTVICERDRTAVRERADAVLAVDPDNEEATGYLAMAQRVGGGRSGESDLAPPVEAEPVLELPDSFVDGRYEVTGFLGEGGRK